MRTASPTLTAQANLGPEDASQKRNDLRWIDAMLDVAKRIWPAKTAAHLAHATARSERAAQFWLAAQSGMDVAAVRALLRSEHGYEFLVPFVGEDCEALWFKRAKLAHEVGVTSRAIRAQEKRVAQLRAQRQQLDLDLD